MTPATITRALMEQHFLKTQSDLRILLDAAEVTINVADPGQKLNGASKFHIGIGDARHYERALPLSRAATERTFRVRVPKNRAVALFIDTDKSISLFDDSSKRVEVGRFASQPIAAGAATVLDVSLRVQ